MNNPHSSVHLPPVGLWGNLAETSAQVRLGHFLKDLEMRNLVLSNADASPKNVSVCVALGSVHDVMAWYGAYFAGDRYTVSLDGHNVKMDQNGEPTNLKEFT